MIHRHSQIKAYLRFLFSLFVNAYLAPKLNRNIREESLIHFQIPFISILHKAPKPSVQITLDFIHLHY